MMPSQDNDPLAEIDAYWQYQHSLKPSNAGSARGFLGFGSGDDRTKLLAEGDSWFDFKIRPDVIDWLERDHGYEIENVARGGQWANDMAYGPDNDQFRDRFDRDANQLEEVVRLIGETRPSAVLISAGGNDLAGPQLAVAVNHRKGPYPGINRRVLRAFFEENVRPAYARMLRSITDAGQRAGLGTLPVVGHGYDYPFPDGRGIGLNGRFVTHNFLGPWLEPSLAEKGYDDLEKRRELIKGLIDVLYETLDSLRAEFPNFHIVDVRGTLPEIGDWHDEMHPTGDGFRRVARRFQDVLAPLLPSSRAFSLPPATAARLGKAYLAPGDARSFGARSGAPDFEDLREGYEALFASCRVNPSDASTLAWYRPRLLVGRDRYRALEEELGVPWYVIAILHSRECNSDFEKHLHNGDPLSGRTVRVPAGRPPGGGPPFTFEESAADALEYDGFLGHSDWSVAATLYRFEKYNGWGYRWHGYSNPYLWGLSQHYTGGGYPTDGNYDPSYQNRQPGTALLLKDLTEHGEITLP